MYVHSLSDTYYAPHVLIKLSFSGVYYILGPPTCRYKPICVTCGMSCIATEETLL